MRNHDPRPSGERSAPRTPSKTADTAAWDWLLWRAYPGRDVEDETQLYVSLTALRARGAALVLEAGRYKLAYGAMNPADYRCFRVKWLTPHTERVADLLRQLKHVLPPREAGVA